MSAICIIPARGGSVRIPRKNIKLFHGKPIIAYSIEAALNSCLFSEVYVSTDDDDIESVARTYPVGIHRRDRCDGSMGTQEVTRLALMSLPELPNFACCLYATAPLMDINDFKLGFHECDSTYSLSVGTDPLRDAGQFYFGYAEAFVDREPLIQLDTVIIPIDERRVCDINTMDDWTRAEKMYEALHA